MATARLTLISQCLMQCCPWCKLLQKGQLEFGELEWFSDIGLFGERAGEEALSAAEVPQLPVPQSSNGASHKTPKLYMPYKKPRIELEDDEKEYFTVPDFG